MACITDCETQNLRSSHVEDTRILGVNLIDQFDSKQDQSLTLVTPQNIHENK